MKDFEIEEILKKALNDNAIPSEQLNEKLKQRLEANSKKRYFKLNVPKTLAASVLLAAVIGAGGQFLEFDYLENNIEISKNDNLYYTDNQNKARSVADEAPSYSKTNEKQNSLGTAEIAKAKSSQIKQAEDASGSLPQVTSAENIQTTAEYKAELDKETTQSEKTYKYLEIAADTLGVAADTLNETVNEYIDYLAVTHTGQDNMAMFASERRTVSEEEASENTVNTEETADDLIDVACSYETLYDGEKYYSVMVSAKFQDDDMTQYKKSFNVDKNKNAVIEFKDLYENSPEAAEKINTKLQLELQEDESFGDTHYEISGNEEFYFNAQGETIIVLGEKEFNLGITN